MSQSSIERLKDYLGQLPPKAQALLMREFERSIERGEDVAVANFVLEQLRSIVRAPSEDMTPRTEDPMRRVFRPLEPFLVENVPHIRPGQIRRASLGPVWLWLGREGCPEAVRTFEAAVAGGAADNAAARALQLAAAEAIASVTGNLTGGERQRTLGRLGATSVVEDIASIGAVLSACDSLEKLNHKLPGQMRAFGESQIRSVMAALNLPSLQTPQVLPFAVALVMNRLAAPWQIVRLGIMMAASDDEIRVAGTPFGITVTMAIHDLSRLAAELRSDIKRGHFNDTSNNLKTLHDGVRGLRTELDIRSESAWGKQLASIRSEISNSLQSEIDSVPGRVRRLLRQGPDKDVTSANRIDPVDIEETAALIDFVAVCRTYASELAINEVSLRAYTELQHYVEKATETLVESLRTHDQRVRAYRLMQMQAAIRFCDVLFGPDYASLMSKAAEMARPVERKAAEDAKSERKPSKAG
ncbi:hypothetical protein [Bradyrhizobium sp. G127]|jgi:hypothetical protein|uniref:hypothetical protein n=1 Tax=Bradyrhizobium sp. G127 TaxID=2904800 RepID=UPI001F3717C0|nr:hypothetical protein [Bradyrhizobium sp. G127]MCF2523048.1 hypothetical protein [Bradyrhizobium sp. G127]